MKGFFHMIKQNEGQLDRMIRVIVGILAFGAGYFFLSGTAQVIAFVVSAIGIGTGVIGFCGLYALLGISTCPVKK